MNIKKRFNSYFSVFLILGILPVFLVAIVIISYAEEPPIIKGTDDGNKQKEIYENIKTESFKCTLPLKDYKDNLIPFVCDKKCMGNIDIQSNIHLELKSATIVSSSEIIEFIKRSELIKIPKRVVDELNRSVAITFSSKVAFDGTNLYVEIGTEFAADHYISVKIDKTIQEKDSIVLQKRRCNISLD